MMCFLLVANANHPWPRLYIDLGANTNFVTDNLLSVNWSGRNANANSVNKTMIMLTSQDLALTVFLCLFRQMLTITQPKITN